MEVTMGKGHVYTVPDVLVEEYERIHKNQKFSQQLHRVLYVMFNKFTGKRYGHLDEDDFGEFYKKYSPGELQKALVTFLEEDIELYTELQNYGAQANWEVNNNVY